MHGLDVKLELLHAGEAVLGAVDAGEGVRGELEAGGLREGGHGHRVERVPGASRRRTRLVLQNLRRDTQNKGIRIQARCNAKRASPTNKSISAPSVCAASLRCFFRRAPRQREFRVAICSGARNLHGRAQCEYPEVNNPDKPPPRAV